MKTSTQPLPFRAYLLILFLMMLGIGGTRANAATISSTPNPSAGSLLAELTQLNVVFSEAVIGVDAADLLINGTPAKSVVVNNPNDYSFTFTQPADGAVQVSWVVGHGIVSASPAATPFEGGIWNYVLDSQSSINNNIVISEFMASNGTGIQDNDGDKSDWIELLNLGTQQTALDGWFLTDTAANLTKWKFPSGMTPLQPNDYLLVWASAKNRTNALAPLHTSFKLPASGGYLALVNPATNIISVFNPYPAMASDISFGRDKTDPLITGFFTNATPGKANAITGPGFMAEPVFNIESGVYTNDTKLLTLASSSGSIRYTLNGTIPLTNSTLYTNAIVLSNNTLIKARVFPPAGTNLFPSAVVVRNILFLDGTTRDFSSELPLMVVSTQGQSVPQDVAPGGKRAEAILGLFDTFQGRSSLRSTPDFIGNVGIEIYGQTSAGFEKKPYRLEIHDELGNDLNISVFGLPAESDFKLRNPFNDKTMLNDFLGYELFEKMGNYSCRRRMVEMFVDSGGGRLRYPADYVGVEVVFEQIKQGNNRVNIAKIPLTATNEPAISGGFIFAKDKDSNGDLNFNTRGGGGFSGQTLKLHEPKPNELRPSAGSTRLTPAGSNQLNYLVRYLNRMEQAMYTNSWLTQTGTNHYTHYLDVDSFVDYHWLVEFTKQIDGIRLSSYFHKDREGKLKAGPVWDWNLAFGNANYWRGGLTNGWYYAQDDQGMNADAHIWLRRLINGSASLGPVQANAWDLGSTPGPGGDPDFNQKVSDRWSVLRTNVFNATNILARIDELSQWMYEATTRDLWGKYRGSVVGVYQWPNPEGVTNSVNGTDASGRDVNYVGPTNYLGQTHNSIIGQMKKFVLGRYLWIDQQFTRKPEITSSSSGSVEGSQVTLTPPPNTTLYYTLNGLDPRASGGGIRSGALSNAGPITITVTSNIQAFARAFTTNSWYKTWSGPAVESFILTTPPLQITEVMYHPQDPAAGSTTTSSDFEFVEIKNVGSTELALERYRLSGGISFTFTNFTLPAGARAVVVANLEAFKSRYPDPTLVIAGQFTGSLNNGGDTLALKGALGEPIEKFAYEPSWYPTTDGIGFSLVRTLETASSTPSSGRSDWRAGSAIGGTPGKPEPQAPSLPAVVINELVAHTIPPTTDRVELYNSGTAAADISGWFLTDNLSSPKKFKIPAGTILQPGTYKVYSEADFNTGTTAFAFSALGEEVYLLSADASGILTGYAHGYSFGAQLEDASLGRYLAPDGTEHFVAQTSPTFGAANSGPKVGPVVINEINYRPQDIFKHGGVSDDSFAEYLVLRNITGTPVPLYDPSFPTNTWGLNNEVEFRFAPNTVLPAQGSIVVVGFNPSNATKLEAFRNRFSIPTEVPIVGPWSGQLNNGGGRVELIMPDEPIAAPSSNAGLVPYVLVDGVSYSDQAPWPQEADGLGASLHRRKRTAFGDSYDNWYAAAPSPARETEPTLAPSIVGQPSDVTVVLTNSAKATFRVTATGSDPLSYQWLRNGDVIPGATGSTLTVEQLNPIKAGRYSVAVLNPGGTTLSQEASLTTIPAVTIATQPRAVSGRPGTNLVLSVVASSLSTLRYQWYFNDTLLPGANASELRITNLKLTDDGIYRVLVSDDVSSVMSEGARLSVLINPVILVQPLSQSVLRGSSAILSVVVSNSATMPIGYRWRRGTTTAQNQLTNSLVSYFVITNIQASNSYSVSITNAALRNGTNSAAAIITVVDDSDLDGMPDEFELRYPTFLNPNDPKDAALDQDGDGMSNLAEYIAGTDPSDKESYLKVESIRWGGNGTQLELFARSNRSYTVEFRESVALGDWQTLTNLPAQNQSRIETILDTYPVSGQRLYRVATSVRTDRAIRTPVILQSPSSVSAIQGSLLQLETVAYGIGELTYQWQMNGVDIPGTTTAALLFNSIQAADQGEYSVKITDATGSVTTLPATVVVLQPPQIITAPASLTVRAGQTARFVIGATGTGTLSYRWLFNGTLIANANGPELIVENADLADQGSYRVIVSQSTVNGLVSVTSDSATLTISP